MPAAVQTFLGKFLKFCLYIRAKFSEISIRPCHLYSGVLTDRFLNKQGGSPSHGRFSNRTIPDYGLTPPSYSSHDFSQKINVSFFVESELI